MRGHEQAKFPLVHCPGAYGVARAASLNKDEKGHVVGMHLTCWVCYREFDLEDLTTLRLPNHVVHVDRLREKLEGIKKFYVPGKAKMKSSQHNATCENCQYWRRTGFDRLQGFCRWTPREEAMPFWLKGGLNRLTPVQQDNCEAHRPR